MMNSFQFSVFSFQFSVFSYSVTQLFSYSVTQLLSYSVTQLLSYSVILLFLSSCGRTYNTQKLVDESAEARRIHNEMMLRANQELVEGDANIIRAFAEKQNWEMTQTQSGLWYMIYSSGSGEQATTGKIATMDYTLSLLDGDLCYSSAELGQKSFRIGHGGVESGLEEGVLLLRTGDKARFIMPPHLAHGLLGDGDCIPIRSIIVYDVELTELR